MRLLGVEASIARVCVIVFGSIAILLGPTGFARGASGPQWAMFHNDAAHTGLSQFNAASNTGAVKWTVPLNRYAEGSPTIAADGTIYITGGNLYAITPSGAAKWQFPIPGNSFEDYSDATPAIAADGTIYFGAQNGNFYSINPAGNPRWALPMNSPELAGNATVWSGVIYVGSFSEPSFGLLSALNPDSTTKWTYATHGDPYPIPSIKQGTLLISNASAFYGGSGLLQLGAAQGTVKGLFPTTDLASGGYAPPIAPDGSCYVISLSGLLVKLDRAGVPQWTTPISPFLIPSGNSAWSSPAMGPDGTIYISGLDAADASIDTLYSVSPAGITNWTLNLTATKSYATSTYYSSPAVSADGVIFVAGGSQLYAVNSDGSLKWTFSADSTIDDSPAIAADKTVYFASDKGTLYALD